MVTLFQMMTLFNTFSDDDTFHSTLTCASSCHPCQRAGGGCRCLMLRRGHIRILQIIICKNLLGRLVQVHKSLWYSNRWQLHKNIRGHNHTLNSQVAFQNKLRIFAPIKGQVPKHIRLEGLKYLGQFKGKHANILNIWGSLRACVQIYEAGRTGSSAPSPAFSEGSTRDCLSVRWITPRAGTSSFKHHLCTFLEIAGSYSIFIKYSVHLVKCFKMTEVLWFIHSLLCDFLPSLSLYTFWGTLYTSLLVSL